MSSNIIPINANEHANLKVKPNKDLAHLHSKNLIPALASEFIYLANNFPIVFVKEEGTGKFRCAALTGFETGENVVFTPNRNASTYLPLDARRYPFYLSNNPQSGTDDLALCIDADSPLLSQDEGLALFNDGGEPSNFLEEIKAFLADFYQKSQVTQAFVDYLAENELIGESELKINTPDSETISLRGIYTVSEEKLRELDDTKVLEIHKQNYFKAIYTHLSSLGQIRRLLDLKASN